MSKQENEYRFHFGKDDFGYYCKNRYIELEEYIDKYDGYWKVYIPYGSDIFWSFTKKPENITYEEALLARERLLRDLSKENNGKIIVVLTEYDSSKPECLISSYDGPEFKIYSYVDLKRKKQTVLNHYLIYEEEGGRKYKFNYTTHFDSKTVQVFLTRKTNWDDPASLILSNEDFELIRKRIEGALGLNAELTKIEFIVGPENQ